MVLFTVAAWLNPGVGQPSEGSVMKRLCVCVWLLACASVTLAQTSVPTAANVEYYGHLIEEAATKRRLITAGVDGITTNRPGWLR